MDIFERSPGNTLAYEYIAPTAPQGVTFTFFNALSGSADMWRGAIGDALLAEGHGLLLYNMRGQPETSFTPGTSLDMDLVVADAMALLGFVAPTRPVYVGLSIGGLFAAHVHLLGTPCVGLAFINTLRRDGPRLEWINSSVTRAAEIGGPALMMDLMTPLLFDEPWLRANRAAAFDSANYQPIDQSSGAYSLLANGRTADWDIDWNALTMPALVLTGRRDHVFYVESDVAQLSARMPAAVRVDLDDAGHMVPVEQPDTLVAELLTLAARAI